MLIRILGAFDRSPHAREALRQAADIAPTQRAQLTVLTSYSTVLAWPAAEAILSEASQGAMTSSWSARVAAAMPGGSSPSGGSAVQLITVSKREGVTATGPVHQVTGNLQPGQDLSYPRNVVADLLRK